MCSGECTCNCDAIEGEGRVEGLGRERPWNISPGSIGDGLVLSLLGLYDRVENLEAR